MTYNWNTMVDITVPTGTNGWLYSGEVIINGVKVRFPVGVPTSVPEPAAVLLKKMIELEQEEDANTAKPQNHYVGAVTIPEGKTLTLQKGAKIVDENNAPTVILPETVLTYTDDGYIIGTPLSATPTEGATAVITYNGVEYTSPILYMEDEGHRIFAMGNTEPMGLTGGNAEAPFMLMLFPDGMGEAYGVCMAISDVTSVTLSIVEKAETESAGIFTAHATITTLTTTELELSEWNVTFETLYETYISGRAVQVLCARDGLIYRGRINVGGTMNDTKMLIMDVARGTLVPGYYTVALVDDGSGGVQSNLVGKVVGSD